MNRFIKSFEAVQDADLMICEHNGVAYQADMSIGKVTYGEDYFEIYKSYEDTPIATALNAGRCAMLMRNAEDCTSVLDIGAGCGTFVRKARTWGFEAMGFDVNQKTVEHLKRINAYADDPSGFDVVTFWDSIEHIEFPEKILERVRKNAIVLAAIPVFDDLKRIRDSKHYRPGEHFYYFTQQGFIDWMSLYDFRLIETSEHEVKAGRESIGAFAFCHDL